MSEAKSNGRFYGTEKWRELAGRYALLQRDPPEGHGVDAVCKALHARIPWGQGIHTMTEAQLRNFVEKGEAYLEEENSGA